MATVRQSTAASNDVPVIGAGKRNQPNNKPMASGTLEYGDAKKSSVRFNGVIDGAIVSFYVPNTIMDKLGGPDAIKLTIEAV